MGVVEDLIQKTYSELEKSAVSRQNSRSWKDPEGYRYLIPWTNLVLLRFFIRLMTNSLPAGEYRRKIQIDDAGRSAVRNIEEGFKRSTTKEYLEFIGFSQGSLEEVKGDIRELTEDGFLKSQPGLSLNSLGIDLKIFNRELRENKGKLEDGKKVFSYIPLTVLYSPLKPLKSTDLSYEIFIEIINKTDFLLQKLVVSLENKLSKEKNIIKLNRFV